MKREIFKDEHGEWVWLYGYAGLYKIYTNGDIYSTLKKKFLKRSLQKNGYVRVTVYKDGNQAQPYLHRLLAENFIDNPDPDRLTQVNHIDGVKTNNIIENLEWTTASKNMKHAYDNNLIKNKHSEPKALKCLETGECYKSMSEAARDNGLHYSAIQQHIDGIIDSVKGLHFVEIDYNDYIEYKDEMNRLFGKDGLR